MTRRLTTLLVIASLSASAIGKRINVQSSISTLHPFAGVQWKKDDYFVCLLKEYATESQRERDAKYCLANLNEFMQAEDVLTEQRAEGAQTKVPQAQAEIGQCFATEGHAMKLCPLKGFKEKQHIRVSYTSKKHVPNSCLKRTSFKHEDEHGMHRQLLQAAMDVDDCGKEAWKSHEAQAKWFDYDSASEVRDTDDDEPPAVAEDPIKREVRWEKGDYFICIRKFEKKRDEHVKKFCLLNFDDFQEGKAAITKMRAQGTQTKVLQVSKSAMACKAADGHSMKACLLKGEEELAIRVSYKRGKVHIPKSCLKRTKFRYTDGYEIAYELIEAAMDQATCSLEFDKSLEDQGKWSPGYEPVLLEESPISDDGGEVLGATINLDSGEVLSAESNGSTIASL